MWTGGELGGQNAAYGVPTGTNKDKKNYKVKDDYGRYENILRKELKVYGDVQDTEMKLSDGNTGEDIYFTRPGSPVDGTDPNLGGTESILKLSKPHRVISLRDAKKEGFKHTRPLFMLGQTGFSSLKYEGANIKQVEVIEKLYPQRDKMVFSDMKKNVKTKFVQKVFDSLAPIKNFLGEDAYILTRLARRAEGVLTAGLEFGGIEVTQDKLTDPNKSYLSLKVNTKKKALFDILKPLGTESERRRFFAWIALNRASKLAGKGLENFFSQDDIRTGLTLNLGNTFDAVSNKRVRRKQLYERISREYGRINKEMVDVGVKFGLFDKDTADRWDKQFYVPFFRVLEDERQANETVIAPGRYASLVGQEGVKRLKGAPEAVNNPFDNILLNWLHILDASLKNHAARNAIDRGIKTIDPATGNPFIEKAQAGAKNAVTITRGGKPESYTINEPMIFDALSSQYQDEIKFPGMDYIIGAKRLFTQLTTAGVSFKVRNAIRDTVTTAGTTDVGYNLYGNMFGGKALLKDREAKARMLVNGGYMQFGHIDGGSPDFSRRVLERNLDRRYILNNPEAHENFDQAMGRYWKFAKTMWGQYEDWGNELENANRAALFRRKSQQTGSDLLASYYARDVLDFSLQGTASAVRLVNQMVPFTNARLQGLYKMGRSVKDHPESMAMVTSGVVMVSLLNYLAYRDDDDWKEREEWDKDTYYWFKIPGTQTAFRIPMPHEFGVIGTMAWRSYAAAFDNDPIHRELFAERMGAVLKHELSLDPTPQIIKPLYEIAVDYNNFTGRPIEGPAMKRLSPEERRRTYTSETAIGVSRAMSKVLWDEVTLSPIQIEYLIKGYLSWMGQLGLFATDMIVRTAGDFPERPGRELTEWPIARDFFQRTPIRNTTYGNIFYRQLQEMEQLYADIQTNKRVGDYDRYRELLEDNRDKLRYRKFYARRQDAIQSLNNRLKKISNSKTMTADEKTVLRDRLEQIRNRMLRMTVERALR